MCIILSMLAVYNMTIIYFNYKVVTCKGLRKSATTCIIQNYDNNLNIHLFKRKNYICGIIQLKYHSMQKQTKTL